MSAVLPLLGGLLLGRFVADRRLAIATQVIFFLVAAGVLVASAPSHDSSHAQGALLAAILAPVSVATLALGTLWRTRTTVAVSASQH